MDDLLASKYKEKTVLLSQKCFEQQNHFLRIITQPNI